eukprot:2345408-Rhodomonas_salina.1
MQSTRREGRLALSSNRKGAVWARGCLSRKVRKNHMLGCCNAPAHFPAMRPPGCDPAPSNWLD